MEFQEQLLLRLTDLYDSLFRPNLDLFQFSQEVPPEKLSGIYFTIQLSDLTKFSIAIDKSTLAQQLCKV